MALYTDGTAVWRIVMDDAPSAQRLGEALARIMKSGLQRVVVLQRADISGMVDFSASRK